MICDLFPQINGILLLVLLDDLCSLSLMTDTQDRSRILFGHLFLLKSILISEIESHALNFQLYFEVSLQCRRPSAKVLNII